MPDQRVCVTGASGFLASHVVRELLERGYAVRGTVRNARDSTRTAHLEELARTRPGTLELVEADLLERGSFDAAVASCDAIFHMASPVVLGSSDPQREVIDPALKGTHNVFDAVERAEGIRRVVLTSSIAAMRDEDLPVDHLFTEADWNESASIERNAYQLSKTLAERAAWERAESLPCDMVALNPTVVLGPAYAEVQARGSLELLMRIVGGKLPALPRLSFSLVDVRDVALAHIAALERPEAQGRHILYNRTLWMSEIADIVRQEFPDRRVPRFRLPDWTVYIGAIFDRRVTWEYLRSHLGVQRHIDNTRARTRLGIEFRPIEETVVDSARSLVELGVV